MMDGGNLYFNSNFSNKESQRKLKSDIQSRIVALIDMDCFYVQVEQRLAPEWKGKPCAVVQYNEWKGGGIIAVGYEARAKGVTRRGMRGDDAKQVCPDVKLFSVPEIRGKADLTRYREAGAEVISVLTQFTGCRVERASIDEAYIDLTDKVQDMMSQVSMSQLAIPTTQDLPHTFVVGSDNDNREDSLREWLESLSSPDSLDSHNDLRLCFGAVIVEKMRKAVRDQTGFDCSAGISHNKVLSKLACGLHKPQKQTILGISAVPDLFATFPISKVRHFGGKLGQSIKEDFGVNFIGECVTIPLKDLSDQYGSKTANFIHDMCRGHDPEPVNDRQLPKSVGCSKNFGGKLIITTYKKARYWLKQLSAEVEERLSKDREQNHRIPKSLSMSVRFTDYQWLSRALPLSKMTQQAIENSAMTTLTKICGEETTVLNPAITCLSLSAGKFEELEGKSLTNYFSTGAKSTVDIFDSMAPPSPELQVVPTPPLPPSNDCSLKAFFNDSHKVLDPFNSLANSFTSPTKPEPVKPKGIAKYFKQTSLNKVSPKASVDVFYDPSGGRLSDDVLDVDSYSNSGLQDDCIERDESGELTDLGEGNSERENSKDSSLKESDVTVAVQEVLDELIDSFASDSSTHSTSKPLAELTDGTEKQEVSGATVPHSDTSFLDVIEKEERMFRERTNQVRDSVTSLEEFTNVKSPLPIGRFIQKPITPRRDNSSKLRKTTLNKQKKSGVTDNSKRPGIDIRAFTQSSNSTVWDSSYEPVLRASDWETGGCGFDALRREDSSRTQGTRENMEDSDDDISVVWQADGCRKVSPGVGAKSKLKSAQGASSSRKKLRSITDYFK